MQFIESLYVNMEGDKMKLASFVCGLILFTLAVIVKYLGDDIQAIWLIGCAIYVNVGGE